MLDLFLKLLKSFLVLALVVFALMFWWWHSVNQPHWHTVGNKDFGISLESPCGLIWESEMKVHVVVQKIREWDSGANTGVSGPFELGGILAVGCHRTLSKGKGVGTDKVLEDFTFKLRSGVLQEAHWASEPVTCSGMPATLTTGSYNEGGKPHSFSHLLVVKGRQYWTVEVDQHLPIKDGTMQKRIIDSVKIAPDP